MTFKFIEDNASIQSQSVYLIDLTVATDLSSFVLFQFLTKFNFITLLMVNKHYITFYKKNMGGGGDNSIECH